MSYFYGNQGIKVIPNVRCGVDELLPEFLEAIPKHCMIAIGTHGFCKEISEKCEWRCFLEKIIPELKPSVIVSYGCLNGKIFDDIKNNSNFVFYEPWITTNRKGDKNDVN